MVGLDAAGKTTLLYKANMGEVVTTIPTIGFNVETLEAKKLQFTAWDVGGRDKIRPLWRHFTQQNDAIIFVVDSNDRDRIDDARQELDWFLNEHTFVGAPLLLFANKQDLPNAMKPEEVAAKMGLEALRDRAWHVEGSVATTGVGMFEGFNWLAETLNTQSSGSTESSDAGSDPQAGKTDVDVIKADRSLLNLATKYWSPKAKSLLNLL